MKRIISFAMIALVLGVISCKKSSTSNDITPQVIQQLTKCPLKNVNSDKGIALSSFEYTLSRIKRIVNKEGEEVGTTFTYNIKNQIEKMEISTPRPEDTYTVLFVYDATAKIIKTKTSVKGYEFQVNDFVYTGDKITKINTSFDIFGYKVGGITRVEYIGENVSKVYTKIEGEPELLTFEGVSYDTKAQFYPDGYRTMALGFVGLANNFFAFFGKNNPISVKIYDDNGKLEEATDIVYEYSKNGLPSKGIKTITKGTNKTVLNVAYQYVCN